MDVFQNNRNGHIFINMIEKNIKLDDSSRKLLKEIVVNYYIEKYNTMGIQQFQDVTDTICRVFNDKQVKLPILKSLLKNIFKTNILFLLENKLRKFCCF